MTGSPAVAAKDVLVTAGVVAASGVGWRVFVGRMVDDPDTIVTMMDTPGKNPNPKWLLNEPTIQALVRGGKDDYSGGWSKAKEVQDVLLGITPQVVNGDRWDGVLGMGDVTFLKYDEKNRPIFSVNFRMYVEPAASALTNREVL